MKTTFRAIDIHAFDVHTLLTPLVSKTTLAPQFSFLTDAAAYRSQYKTGEPVVTKSFHVHPLSNHIQNENHFWKNYLRQFDDAKIDYWRSQAPFLGSMRRPFVKLVADAPGTHGRAGAAVYLSALGWSTNLNLHLSGELTLPAILNFVLAILNRQSAQPPAHLEIEGKQMSLADIFGCVKKKLLQEVYDSQNPPQDNIRTPRHLIVSLSRFDGPPIYYQKTIERKGMSDNDQALLHSILRGEEIKTDELAQKLRERPYTLVTFDRRPDFMLIYFEYGALIFMQQSALGSGKRQRALSCFASNARSAAVMIWTLFNFYNTSSVQAATDKTIKATREIALANLKAMGEQYLAAPELTTTSIRYGNALFKNHTKLNQLMSSGGDVK